MRPLGLAVFLLLGCASAFHSNTVVQRKKSDAPSFEDAMKEFVDDWDAKHLPEDDVPLDEPSLEEDEEGVPGGQNCSKCAQSHEKKAMRLAGIRSQILNQLRMNKPPNVTGKHRPHAPPFDHLLDHYHMQADAPGHHTFVPGPEYSDEDEFHITTEKVLSFAHRHPNKYLGDESDNILYFKFSGSVTNFHVQSAHLWLFIRPNQLVPQRNITLYQIASRQNEFPELIQIRKKTVEKKSRHGHWIVFEIKKLVIHWIRYMKENHGLLVRTTSPDPIELVLDHIEDDTNEDMRPFLEIKVEKQRHRRSKRMIGLNCEENSQEVRCCRYPLTVDFTEFGWDWIIAPLQYEANYCSGECPYVFLQKYPHTHLVQQANRQGSAGPCCAPRKMSPISMIYFDADYNIVYGILPGMVVDRCGCS